MIAVLVANRQLALKTNKIINWKKLNKLSQRFKIKERSFVNKYTCFFGLWIHVRKIKSLRIIKQAQNILHRHSKSSKHILGLVYFMHLSNIKVITHSAFIF